MLVLQLKLEAIQANYGDLEIAARIWTSEVLRQDLQILAQPGGNLQIPAATTP